MTRPRGQVVGCPSSASPRPQVQGNSDRGLRRSAPLRTADARFFSLRTDPNARAASLVLNPMTPNMTR